MQRRPAIALAAVVVSALGGCRASLNVDLPQVCAAKGRLRWPDGSPVKASVVQFLMEGNSALSASATTDDTGGFDLRTIYRNHVLVGAREGTYRVEVTLPSNDAQGLPVLVRLPQAVKISKHGERLDLTVPKP